MWESIVEVMPRYLAQSPSIKHVCWNTHDPKFYQIIVILPFILLYVNQLLYIWKCCFWLTIQGSRSRGLKDKTWVIKASHNNPWFSNREKIWINILPRTYLGCLGVVQLLLPQYCCTLMNEQLRFTYSYSQYIMSGGKERRKVYVEIQKGNLS